MADLQLSHHAHAPVQRNKVPCVMATLLLRSSRSSKVPQAASSLAVPPEPPAEQAAAKDRLVHGSAGRHQLATLPSSSLCGATFAGTERGHVVGRGLKPKGKYDKALAHGPYPRSGRGCYRVLHQQIND